MKNKLKEKIQNGGKGIGMFYELGGIPAAECLALGGLDFFIVDCEHGPYDVESAQLAVLAAERHGTTPLVRVKDICRPSILKMLDIGAMGLVVPFLNTLEEVEELVGYAKYSPVGQRGFAPTRVSGFGHAPYAQAGLQSQCATANAQTLLIPQCETLGCLENIEKIAAMEGVDGIFVGPFDLSIAMGMPGAFESDAMQQAFRRVQKACKDAGKLSIIFAADTNRAKSYLAMGYDAVAAGMDTMLLVQAVKNLMAEIAN